MRILCRTCKQMRDDATLEWSFHTNADSQKYYCFCDGSLTDEEWTRELMRE